jgi:hypothetical protein
MIKEYPALGTAASYVGEYDHMKRDKYVSWPTLDRAAIGETLAVPRAESPALARMGR